MCYGGSLLQTPEASAAGIPPSIAGSGPGPEAAPDSILGGAQASQNTPKLDTPENIKELAKIITTESGGCKRAEQIAVGSTVLTRIKRNGTAIVSAVRGGSQDNQDSDDASRQIAQGILNGSIPDNTGGATHFYTPEMMPREGQPTGKWDVRGGLESTAGLSSRNYRPSYATQYEAKSVPGVRDAKFRFFRAPGNGQISGNPLLRLTWSRYRIPCAWRTLPRCHLRSDRRLLI